MHIHPIHANTLSCDCCCNRVHGVKAAAKHCTLVLFEMRTMHSQVMAKCDS